MGMGVALALAPQAFGSELIARNATNVRLEVSADGNAALLSYRAHGRTWYVVARGAINAIPPTRGRRQVSFQLRRSTTRPPFEGGCRHFHLLIPMLVTDCAAGGSSWAVQSWKRALPNFGVKPSPFRAQPELHLSHWSGPVAVLTMRADWSYGGGGEHVYGSLTYPGEPGYGFGATRL